MSTLSNVASELESLSRMPIAPAISLRRLADEIRGSQYSPPPERQTAQHYNREQVIACAREAAEAVFEHFNRLQRPAARIQGRLSDAIPLDRGHGQAD